MALDPDGNLLLAGTSKGTVKLDGDGSLLWSVHDGCSSIVADSAAGVYAAGPGYRAGSGADFRTIKYDPTGNAVWEAWYDGPLSGSDVARHVALDSLGNVVVAGQSSHEYDYTDLVAIKYDLQGSELWVARHAGCSEVADLVLDGGDNVIVTCTNGSYVTVKYDPNGNELWVAEYVGPGDGYGYSFDQPAALVVDDAGNVYVTGESRTFSTPGFPPETQCEMMVGEPAPRRASQAACSQEFHTSGATYTSDYATVKYDPNGNQLWVARYSGLLDLYFWDERATDVAVDAAGNVYVTGNRSAYYFLMHDVVTIKYSPFGAELWKVAYDGPAHCKEQATSLAVDEAGDVYVAGGSIGFGTRKDYLTIKYSESALSVWNAPASAEAAGLGQRFAPASSRFGLIFAFFVPLLALALFRRRLLKSR